MNGRIVTAGLATLIAALALPAIAHGGAASIYVEYGNKNKFAPKSATWGLISSNFAFTWGDPADADVSARRHNVVQDDNLFNSGNPTKTAPGPLSYWPVSASAGTFPYYCELHGDRGGEGMSGKIKVPPQEGSPEPDGVPINWAVDASTTGSRYSVRFKVGDRKWRNWKRHASLSGDIFGRDDDPVDFDGTKTYKIQARSENGNGNRRSDWSPALVIP